MADKDIEQIQSILAKWERKDYITHVRTNGGTPTVEIPIAIRRELHIEPGATVEWKQLEDGSLNITIEPPVKYSLAELAAGITPENRHEYTDTGNPVGKEVW
jgi:antitoxin MazE